MRRAAVALVVVAALFAPMALGGHANAESPVRIFVFGPTVLGLNSTASFNVSVVGGPAESGGNYSIEAYLTGSNLTGAVPQKTSSYAATSPNGTFTFNVTSPIFAGDVTLVVNATSISSKDGKTEKADTTYAISVVEPIIISATIKNSGTIKFIDVPVKFYVDGILVGDKTIFSLDPGAEANVSYDWLTTSIAEGRHEIKITADLNGDGSINEAEGDVVIIQYFYKEPAAIHPAIIIVLCVVAVLAVLFLFLTIRKRRRGW